MSKQEQTIERTYTVPLTRAWISARHRRTKRAMKVLREFAERHMKSSEIKIDTELNERLWNRGITKPPRRIVVKMLKDEDGLVTISLPKQEKAEDKPVETQDEDKSANEEAKPEISDQKKTPETRAEKRSGKKRTKRKN